jgi:hypothetical protein
MDDKKTCKGCEYEDIRGEEGHETQCKYCRDCFRNPNNHIDMYYPKKKPINTKKKMK